MNPPRTKPIIRYSKRPPVKKKIQHGPDGGYSSGIGNPRFAQIIGYIVSLLPHVEERMILIMAVLLGGDPQSSPAQQIFRSLNSEDARVKILTSLLEHCRHNDARGPEYDEIIALFVEIKKKRNAYAHGLWWTHDSGRMFLEEASPDTFSSFLTRREVQIGELNAALKRISEFFDKSKRTAFPDIYDAEGKLKPLPPPVLPPELLAKK
jgi:hypothetical protein